MYFKEKKYLRLFSNKYLKLLVLFITLFWFSVSGFLYFEQAKNTDLTWLDAIWWSIVTMTTVGYGDYFPVTPSGRFFVAVPSMVIGIGMLGFVISDICTRLIESKSKKMRGQSKVTSEGHILIINYPGLEKVKNLVLELRSDHKTRDKRIVLIDEKLDELPPALHEVGVRFIKGNPTDEDVLNRANIQQAAYALILIEATATTHSDDINLATALVYRNRNKELYIIAEAMNPDKNDQYKIAGCDSVICLSEFSTNFFIQELQDPGVKDIIYNLTSNRIGQQVYLIDIQNIQNKNYKDVVLRSLDLNVSTFGLMRNSKALLNCSASETLQAGDKAILVSKERPEAFSL